MKQPLLGRKIQEWRKAKGLTQEELVERCNINVRTIQRIEAGEVTPRTYTVKAILEALGVANDEINAYASEGISHESRESSIPWLKYGFVAGIAYLILAILESVWDIQLLSGKQVPHLEFLYSALKISVLLSFLIFMGGIFRLAVVKSNLMLKIASIFLVAFTAVAVFEDVLVYWMRIDLFSGLIFRSILFGLHYAVFGIALILAYKKSGNIYLVAGAIGVVTGFGFLTVLFAIPALVLLTFFEILLVVILYQEWDKLVSTFEWSVNAEAQ